jgi:hypothetical protein
LRRKHADRAIGRRGVGRGAVLRHLLERMDQIVVGTVRLVLMPFQFGQDVLDAINGGEDEADGIRRNRHAVAELAHQRFGGMGERLEPRQVEEAARTLDGVNQSKDVGENLGVVRFLFKANELDVDDVESFICFGQELPQQVVHRHSLLLGGCGRATCFPPTSASLSRRRLISVANWGCKTVR